MDEMESTVAYLEYIQSEVNELLHHAKAGGDNSHAFNLFVVDEKAKIQDIFQTLNDMNDQIAVDLEIG